MINAIAIVCAILMTATQSHSNATIDLATDDGIKVVAGQWKYCDARIVEADSKDADGKPARTHDIEPKAGAMDFDDSAWQTIGPTTLGARRGAGRVSFAWYRINVTVPPKIRDVDPTGSTIAFEIVVDDYAEVWVNGKLPLELGQSGGSVVAGFNVPNRVILTRDAKPGERFQIAVFAMNGPISTAPDNYIFVRSAKLTFE